MRKLLWFTLGFGGSCAFCAYVYRGAWIIAAGAVLLFTAVGGWLLSEYWKPARLIGMVLLGLAAGSMWFMAYQYAYLNAADRMDGQTEFAVIEVTDYSWEGSYGTTVDGKTRLNGKTFHVRAYLDGQKTFLPGDGIRGEFSFTMTAEEDNHNSTYHQGKGIFLLAYQRGEISVNEISHLPLRYYPVYLRMRILDLIEDTFPEDASAFAKALLLG
jgi:competence protein ComEC